MKLIYDDDYHFILKDNPDLVDYCNTIVRHRLGLIPFIPYYFALSLDLQVVDYMSISEQEFIDMKTDHQMLGDIVSSAYVDLCSENFLADIRIHHLQFAYNPYTPYTRIIRVIYKAYYPNFGGAYTDSEDLQRLLNDYFICMNSV